MYSTETETPAQRTALLVLSIATPILAGLLVLLFMSLRRDTKEQEARNQYISPVGHPQLIPEPPKTYAPPVGIDLAKGPPVVVVTENRPTMSMPEPHPYRPGGTPIGELPSLEVTPPSLPNSLAGTPYTSRSARSPRSPQIPTQITASPRSPISPGFVPPRSPRAYPAVPPATPFGDVADQPLSAHSLERMMHSMESDLKSPAPGRSPRPF